MASTPTKAMTGDGTGIALGPAPLWLPAQAPLPPLVSNSTSEKRSELQFSRRDALQALLAFSALHQQVRQQRSLAAQYNGADAVSPAEFEPTEQFVLDEVLQLVAERAIAITGADGLAIALAENNEIVLRASAGAIKPDVGARIQRDSAFSGACFRTAQIIRCDDTETDHRVNLEACRRLGARSMVAVPLCGRRRVIGLLEAFAAEPFGFNDSDVSSLQLLAELILGALKPEDEDRFAESALVAESELATPESASSALPENAKSDIETATFSTSASAMDDETSGADTEIVAPELGFIQFADESGNEIDALDEAALSFEVLPHVEPPEDHHPGTLLVLILAVVASLLAAGIWWKLRNAQLSKAPMNNRLVQLAQTQPTQKRMAASAQPSNTSAALILPSSTTPPSNLRQNEQTASVGSLASPAVDTNIRNAAHESAAPQEAKVPRITAIRHWSSGGSSTVVLDLEDQVQYEAHRLSNPDRIYFDLHDTAPAPEVEGKTIEIGDELLARVRVAQQAVGLTRVVLETKGNSNYSVSLEPSPYRLVVLVRKPGADPKARVNLFPGAAETEREKMAIVVPPPTREDLQLRARVQKMRIVVDAGHGGWDLGTVGRRGLLEKDLVLEIAQRLSQLLESRLGADVVLTRNNDNYIPLDQRAGMANQSQADLFVSVHANYSDLPSARGVETYYTNFFSSPVARDLDATEPGHSNSVTVTGLSPAELHEKIEQSRRLAASVQRSLYATLSLENPGLRDRGVKEASYVVLTETAMPGILAEVSFVSSPTDEQKLRSDGYREQIAEALYKGIARYAANSRGVKVASAAK